MVSGETQYGDAATAVGTRPECAAPDLAAFYRRFGNRDVIATATLFVQ
jgi:hypothetical protein